MCDFEINQFYFSLNKKMKQIQNLLNYDYIMKNTPEKSKLKIKLKKTHKGLSLFAKKKIKKNNIIAYYKLKVYNINNFHGINNNMYTFGILNKDGTINDYLIGDLYEESLDEPKYNIPFWAYLSNEPSLRQQPNAYIENNVEDFFKGRDEIKEGDIVIYKLRASCDIKIGEEICWCYGKEYTRNYKISRTCYN